MVGVRLFNFLTDEEIGFRKLKSEVFLGIQKNGSGPGFGDFLVQNGSQEVQQEGYGISFDP